MNFNKYILHFYFSPLYSHHVMKTTLGINIGTEDPLESQANILNGTWNLEPLSEKPSIKDVTPVTKDGMEVQVFNDIQYQRFYRRWYLLYSKH